VDLFAQKYIYVVAFGSNEQTREPLEASFFGDINRFERASVPEPPICQPLMQNFP
jgi:hypothetical protein